MKIWLDDFRPMPEGFDVHCRTYEEAEVQLLTGKVTCISFDYDLGDYKKGGLDLAKFIARGAHNGTIPFLGWAVHSTNAYAWKINEAMAIADKYWPQDIKIED